MQTPNTRPSISRRGFIKQSSAVAATTLVASAIAARSYAAEDNTIKIGMVGCGGRGGGAVIEALNTKGPAKFVAVADCFKNKAEDQAKRVAQKFPDKFDCPPDRIFGDFDGYKKVIDAVGPGGLVLLTTPPTFRPIHMEYAVEKGCHIFMEKSFGVDAPGVRRVMKAGEAAKAKNLKIAGGLMSRHYVPLEECIKQIHDGAIGDVITLWPYREHGPVGFKPRQKDEPELAHQIRNYSNYTWINGSFLLDWLIHNLDICCWVKNAWPVSAQGQGGRQVRAFPDQLFDHYSVEYRFADGTRMMAQGRHQDNVWNFFGSQVHGSKGSAVLGEGVPNPRIFKGWSQEPGDMIWQYKGPGHNGYQYEHDLLFDAIRNDKPWNESDRCARAAMVGIMGRMAAESGKMVTWDEAMASNVELAPGLEKMTWDTPSPAQPDEKGQYPIAKPGITKGF